MVGREFVPNEDMGEWTIHLDAPEGTSLDGTTDVAFQAAEGTERHRRRRADRAVDRRLGRCRLADAHPLPLSGAAASRSARTRRRRSSRRCGGGSRRIPSYRPSIIVAQRARQRRRARAASRSPRTSSAPTLDQIAEYSKKALVAAQKLPSLTEVKAQLNVSNPEVHVAVDRKRAADLGVRMATVGNTLRLAVVRRRRDLLLQGRAGAVSGQDPRARESAARHRRRSAGSPCRRRPVRSASTTSRARARPRTDHAAALEPAVHGQPDRRCRARPRARRGVERRPRDARRAQHAVRRCRSGCRDSRRFSTRRRPT